jgi:phosphate transport system substrate-binding protein
MDSVSAPMHKRKGMVGTGVAVAIAVVLLIVGFGGGYVTSSYLNKTSTSVTQLTETGSSLLYPLMKIWAPAYSTVESNVAISVTSSGSGSGQAAAENGKYNIGASDPYVANATETNILNVPVAISAQLVYYNLPGVVGHLNLNGTILGMIYAQQITEWNNSMILAAQTPGHVLQLQNLSGMAANSITVIKRSDSSGDTNLFSAYCWLSWKSFPYSVNNTAFVGLKTTLTSTVLPETGNSGMQTGVEGTPGGIAYIGISYEATTSGANVNYAALGNNESNSALGGIESSNYVLPSAATISQDANLGLQNLNYSAYGLAITLTLGGVHQTIVQKASEGQGGSNPTTAYPTPYPDVNLEYALIKAAPTGSVVTAKALLVTVQFLEWAISAGNNETLYLSQVGFVPLTPEVAGLDMQTLGTVQF